MSQQVALSRAHIHAVDPALVTRLRRDLLDERDQHRSQLADLHVTLDDISGQSDVDSMLTREMAERAVVRTLAVIAEIEHALRSMENGTYGLCERCEGAMPSARLEAIPYARYCVGCPPALLF